MATFKNKKLSPLTDEVIYKHLSRQITVGKVKEFKQANELDAVILGCTELPLMYGESQNNEKVIDTLQLLADGLLKTYFLIPNISLTFR